MEGKHVFQAVHSVFGCIAVDAFVDNVVGVAVIVEVALQVVWIRLACCDAVACCEGITKAYDDRPCAVGWLCLCCAMRMERSGDAERKKKQENVSARHIGIVIRGSESRND